ncbi:MAG TPA: hypothetical protein VMY59_00070 [Candidatus Thermoplasmatota archaeon]|nr:hypothetical protein [Candidatus Thermoplasmatota archaeon]
MKKKAILIGVMLLLGASVFTTTISAQNNQTGSGSLSRGLIWSDNFDSYVAGSTLGGQGGWFPWDNAPSADANVTDVQSHSPDNSVEIKGGCDMVHEWDNVNTGNCTFRAWTYVPADFEGSIYIILLSLYSGSASKWDLQIHFNSETYLLEDYDSINATPYVIDGWGEVRVEIDFVNDWQDVYYNDVLWLSKSWTQGTSGGGILALDAVDLWGESGTAVYYDDLSVWATESATEPELEIGPITGGFGVKTSVKNTGTGNATNVDWTIALDGKLVFLGKSSTSTMASLAVGADEPIKAGFILGFGKTNIVVSAICDEGKTAEKTATAFVLGPFIIGVT